MQRDGATIFSLMDRDLTAGAVCSPSKLLGYSARGRHYSPAARLQIVEESFTTGARVEDTALLYGISRSQLHAWRKKYDGRDVAEDGKQLVSFAPVVIGEPALEAAPAFAGNGNACAGRMEIICPGGHRVIVGSDVDPATLRLVLGVLER